MISGELLVIAKSYERSSAVSVFCCSGKLDTAQNVQNEAVGCAVPVETYRAQVGCRKRDVWWVQYLDFRTTDSFNMMFLNMAHTPYLPYVDVEVANNTASVSLAPRSIYM